MIRFIIMHIIKHMSSSSQNVCVIVRFIERLAKWYKYHQQLLSAFLGFLSETNMLVIGISSPCAGAQLKIGLGNTSFNMFLNT